MAVEPFLTTKGVTCCVPPFVSKPRVRKGVLMSGRMKALLAALAAIGFAAMNASLPWGP
jgi:hypothetical protein